MSRGPAAGRRLTSVAAVATLGVLVALGVLVVSLSRPSAASARASYLHGGIQTCEYCHQDNHLERMPTTEECTGCHTGYANPDASLHCYSCHAPAQDTSPWRTEAACTTSCHLLNGTTVTHAAHPDKPAACLTCHPLTVSLSDSADSPHHLAPVPPAPVVTSFLPASGEIGTAVTVSGSGLMYATAVAFGGARCRLHGGLGQSPQGHGTGGGRHWPHRGHRPGRDGDECRRLLRGRAAARPRHRGRRAGLRPRRHERHTHGYGLHGGPRRSASAASPRPWWWCPTRRSAPPCRPGGDHGSGYGDDAIRELVHRPRLRVRGRGAGRRDAHAAGLAHDAAAGQNAEGGGNGDRDVARPDGRAGAG